MDQDRIKLDKFACYHKKKKKKEKNQLIEAENEFLSLLCIEKTERSQIESSGVRSFINL